MTTRSGLSVTIERLGSEGDGLARGPDGRLIVVPFALPGEVLVGGAIATPSAERVAALGGRAFFHQMADAEIRELGAFGAAGLAGEDVARLKVAMDDALSMGVNQRLSDIQEERMQPSIGKPPLMVL